MVIGLKQKPLTHLCLSVFKKKTFIIHFAVNFIGETDAITFEDFILRKPVPKLWKAVGAVRENCSTHMGK